MIPREVMTRLATLGLSHDHAEAVAAMLSAVEDATRAEAEAVVEKSRAKTRDRVAKWRQAHGSNVTERNTALQTGSRERVTRVEDITSNSVDKNQEKKERTSPKASAGVREFSEALPELEGERLKAFVAHRRVKRAAFSGHAADLFRKDAMNCGLSVVDAADMAMSRNWITVKPEFLTSRGPPGLALQRPAKASLASKFRALGEQMRQADEIRSDSSNGGLRAPVSNLSLISGGRG